MRAMRRGTSLIEMLVVITTISFVLSGTGICLHGMYRADRRTRESLVRHETLQRLALQFRTDAHQAAAVRVKADGNQPAQGMTLAQPNGRSVEYRWADGSIERHLRDGEKRLHDEAFRLPPANAVQWQVSEGKTPLASLLISARPERDGAEAGAAVWRIDAALGVR